MSNEQPASLDDLQEVRHNALRNALYHAGRRRSYEFWHKLCSFIIVILGASSTTEMITTVTNGHLIIGALVAIIGSWQLVYGIGSKSRDHEFLHKQYVSVLEDMERKVFPSEQECADWKADMIGIASGEPPIYRALDAQAANDALDSIGYYDEGERLHIPFLHKILGRFLSFDGHRYDKYKELEWWNNNKIAIQKLPKNEIAPAE